MSESGTYTRDRVVTVMLARWNSPPRWTSRGDWPKPAAASAMVASMVTAVAALHTGINGHHV